MGEMKDERDERDERDGQGEAYIGKSSICIKADGVKHKLGRKRTTFVFGHIVNLFCLVFSVAARNHNVPDQTLEVSG